jgi:hypothetical protein
VGELVARPRRRRRTSREQRWNVDRLSPRSAKQQRRILIALNRSRKELWRGPERGSLEHPRYELVHGFFVVGSNATHLPR